MKNKHSKRSVSIGMHYATMAALIISNITVFILCIIFSGVLGTGLANIAIIGSKQHASAQELSALAPRHSMKISGILEGDAWGHFDEGQRNSFAPGAQLSAQLSFKDMPKDMLDASVDPNNQIGIYQFFERVTLQIGDDTYTSDGYPVLLTVYNGTEDYVRLEGYFDLSTHGIVYPANSFSFVAGSPGEWGLTSDKLPLGTNIITKEPYNDIIMGGSSLSLYGTVNKLSIN